MCETRFAGVTRYLDDEILWLQYATDIVRPAS